MKMKKLLAVAAALTITASVIAGCGTSKGSTGGESGKETQVSGETKADAKKDDTKKEEDKKEENKDNRDLKTVAYETPTYKKSTEEVAGGNKVTLKTVSMFGGTDPNAAVYNAVIDRFKEQHSNVTIEDDSTTSDEQWKAKVVADFSVGSEPDVLQFFSDATADTLIATDKLVSLDDILKEYPEYAGDTLESSLDQVENTDNVKRAVPTTGFWEGLYINEDLFKANNIEVPTDWASFKTAIEKLKEAKITPIAVSLNNVPHYWVEHLMLYASGLEEYKSVPTTAPEGWINGLEALKTLRDLGAFPEDTDTIDDDMSFQLFNEKKAAMLLDGSWKVNAIDDKDNVKVIPFPGVENQKAEQGTIISGVSSGFYITKKAWDDPDKRDAAVKFVMAQTSKDSLVKYWNGNGLATTEVEAMADMDALAKSGMEYSQAGKAFVGPTDSRIDPEAYKKLISSVVQISTGKEDAKTVLDDILKLSAERQAAK